MNALPNLESKQTEMLDKEISEDIGKTYIHGLLTQVVKSGKEDKKTYQHLVVVPAPDPYSHPTTYPVRAKKMLAPIGSEFGVVCRLSTWKSNGFWNVGLWADE
ncbi:MAG: hypothetical protein EOM23_07715 [Candidatus Moranbacteria bacterium]|nr:hypothetical protein [Candidatus Moranbacteria bacterium]